MNAAVEAHIRRFRRWLVFDVAGALFCAALAGANFAIGWPIAGVISALACIVMICAAILATMVIHRTAQ